MKTSKEHPAKNAVWSGTWRERHEMNQKRIADVGLAYNANGELLAKYIPCKESWHPAYDQVLDLNEDFVSGKVKVSLYPSCESIVYQNKYYVLKWTWMLYVAGADDTMVELFYDSFEAAKATFDALDQCPLRRTLWNLW
jgi:hypothetical protein